jgi:acetoacetyl-CoA synthetase
LSPSAGGLLINIDNGGTLTDFCVMDGANVYRTKSVALWRFHPHNARGGCYIYGRSDSALNRHGVRIGTAEIYRAVEKIPEVADSLIVGELPGGNFFMPLLVLKDGAQFDEDLRREITTNLRQECSPRHVPDRMYVVAGVPRTLTGKKMEVPVRNILMGWPSDKAAGRDAMANPESIDYFVRFAEESLDYQWRNLNPEPVPAREVS